MFNIGKVVNYYQRGMNHHSIITISCFFVVIIIISVYAISTIIIITTTIDGVVTTITSTTSMPIEQLQKRPNGESDENEPITDLPIIDSPCKSSCPPNYKLCLYICK